MHLFAKYYGFRSTHFQIEKNRGMDIFASIVALGYAVMLVLHKGIGSTNAGSVVNEVVLIVIGTLLFSDLIIVPFSTAATMLGTAPMLTGLFNYGLVVPNAVIISVLLLWMYAIGIPKWRVTVFNVCQIGLSVYGTYFTFLWYGGRIGEISKESIVPLATAAVVYMVVNTGLTWVNLYFKMHGNINKCIKYLSTRQYLDSNVLYLVQMFFMVGMTISLSALGLWMVVLLICVLVVCRNYI